MNIDQPCMNIDQPCHFLSSTVPYTADEMHELLQKCSPNNMSPLTEKLVCIGAATNSLSLPTLSFSQFISAVAYPFQSYPLNAEQKFNLYLECKRLFPRPRNDAAPEVRAQYAKNDEKLTMIFKRLVINGVPNGLDAKLPRQTCTPSLSLRLLKGEIVMVNHNGHEKLMSSICHNVLQMKTKDRANHIASLWPRPNNVMEKAKQLQDTLCLLLAEHAIMCRLHEECTILPPTDGAQREVSFYSTCVRINAVSEGFLFNMNPRAEENELHALDDTENTVTSMQYSSFSEKLDEFISKNEKSIQSRLFYRRLQEWSMNFPSRASKALMAHCRKEYLVHETIMRIHNKCQIALAVRTELGSSLINMSSEGEDAIAPFQSVLQALMKKAGNEAREESAIFSIAQTICEQHHVDYKELVALYISAEEKQRNLYAYVYIELHTLVHAQQQRIDFMPFLKCNLFSKEPEALPAKLPSYDWTKRDPFLEALQPALLCKEPGVKSREENQQTDTPPPPPSTSEPKKPRRPKRHFLPGENEAARAKRPELASSEGGARNSSEEEELLSVESIPKPPSLYKKLTGDYRSPFICTERVTRWFVSKIPLDVNNFPEYASQDSDYQRKMQRYHAFSQTVDSFVQTLALKTTWKNTRTSHQDTRYVLPGEWIEGGATERGAFVYAVGRDKKLYHRFFSPLPTDKLVKKVMRKTFEQDDFPELAVATCEGKPSSTPLTSSSGPAEEIFRHRHLGIVSIRTEQRTLNLFPVTFSFPDEESASA